MYEFIHRQILCACFPILTKTLLLKENIYAIIDDDFDHFKDDDILVKSILQKVLNLLDDDAIVAVKLWNKHSSSVQVNF